MKTTVEQFEMFKAEVRRLLKLYGLVCWDAVFEHKLIDNTTDSQIQEFHESKSVIF